MSLKRYTQLPVLLDMLENRRLTVLDPSAWVDRNDTYFLDQYASHRKIPGVLALCLTDASPTYHHWHVYAGNGPSGVRVEFRRKAFTEWVGNSENAGELRQVGYYRLSKREDIKIPDDLPFAKRHAFRDEASGA